MPSLRRPKYNSVSKDILTLFELLCNSRLYPRHEWRGFTRIRIKTKQKPQRCRCCAVLCNELLHARHVVCAVSIEQRYINPKSTTKLAYIRELAEMATIRLHRAFLRNIQFLVRKELPFFLVSDKPFQQFHFQQSNHKPSHFRMSSI